MRWSEHRTQILRILIAICASEVLKKTVNCKKDESSGYWNKSRNTD